MTVISIVQESVRDDKSYLLVIHSIHRNLYRERYPGLASYEDPSELNNHTGDRRSQVTVLATAMTS